MTELQDLIIEYYKTRKQLEPIVAIYEDLKNNPVTYNNETSLEHLEKIIAYREQFTDVNRDMENLNEEAANLNEEIVDILKGLGVPPENKITLKYAGVGNISFWYDASLFIHFSEPAYKRVKALQKAS
jgi:hypothetical protein